MRLSRVLGLVLAVLASSGCRSCVPVQDEPAVEGPESTTVGSGLKGHVVFTIPGGALMDVELPTKVEKTVRPGTKSAAHNVAGPDARGRVAFVTDEAPGHALKVLLLDGTGERVVFARPGRSLWDNATGDYIAMAPTGGNVAILEGTSSVQTGGTGGNLLLGALEVWNVDSGKGGPIGVMAGDVGMSFFPSGERLAYVAFDSKIEAEKLPSAKEAMGKDWALRDKTPVVHVRDLATKKDEAIGIGEYPVVSTDGTFVLVVDGERKLRRIDVGTKASAVVEAPGFLGHPVGASGSLVIYHALGTKGVKPKTRPMSMGGSETLHTLKIAQVGTHELATLAEGISIHSRASFGQPSP
jgi:hypothetical protein